MTPLGRIAHLIESDGPGGAERVVVEMATALQAAGTQNVVFLPARGEGWLGEQLRGSGVAVEHFHLSRPFSPECARDLIRKLASHRVDVAHSHEFSLAVYGAWAACRVGIPHVITMHGGRYYSERLRRRLALRGAVTMSDRTIAVSRELACTMSRLLWLPAERIRVIPNGVRQATAERVTLRDELALQPGDQLLLALGNLYPVKGHRHLVAALAALAARHPALHVAIGGRGDLASALLTQAETQGVSHRLHLLGLRNDVPALLEATDIFVLPSLAEGLPLVLLEAMFAGKPIVASNVGEVSIALAGGDAGVLVPPGDEQALAQAIDSLLQDPRRARTLGARARDRANAHYDVERMVSRYVKVYKALVRRRQAATVDSASRSRTWRSRWHHA
jgi:glycosyltransferase involved in cell wall biosynthesis